MPRPIRFTFLLTLLALMPALAGTPENKRAHADTYPVLEATRRGEVVFAPNLDEWKPEVMAELYEDGSLKDRFSVRLGMAYDTEHLYLAARFVDTSPLVNRTNPKLNAVNGWNGDAFQLRLVADSGVTQPVPGSDDF